MQCVSRYLSFCLTSGVFYLFIYVFFFVSFRNLIRELEGGNKGLWWKHYILVVYFVKLFKNIVFFFSFHADLYISMAFTVRGKGGGGGGGVIYLGHYQLNV